MIEKVVRHQRALSIARSPKDRQTLPLWLLLRQTARDAKDVPPLVGGSLLRSVLTGGPYPTALVAAVVRRIRADHLIHHPRAAILKAFLTRNYSLEVAEMLDVERPEPAYHLGRLFAALEKTQEDALGKGTIKDRFFGAASATPATVFPRLLRLSQHHIAKLEGGRRVNAERRVQEIASRLTDFPLHLDLTGQGLFALGYYHQRLDFFTPKGSKPGQHHEVDLGA
jgi:CRISPR-associated protein Csd1